MRVLDSRPAPSISVLRLEPDPLRGCLRKQPNLRKKRFANEGRFEKQAKPLSDQIRVATTSDGWTRKSALPFIWLTAKVMQHSTGSIDPGEGRGRRSCFPISLLSAYRVLVCSLL